ncbi:hypothetical protein [Aureimonas ureilytica]|uniref:hypothetical protein n=1 Tax=Aureimonas ureilytica TaxID=401562 RepID=UPI0004765BBF|nr:hypothetical protein [Aureimonas ureilytica]
MSYSSQQTATFDPLEVERLARGRHVDIMPNPLQDIYGFDVDYEDICEWLSEFNDHISRKDCAFIKSRPTEKYPPGTTSYYYQAYVAPCRATIFIKFAIYRDILVITSFKEYNDD